VIWTPSIKCNDATVCPRRVFHQGRPAFLSVSNRVDDDPDRFDERVIDERVMNERPTVSSSESM
jgi:hypothetical protein